MKRTTTPNSDAPKKRRRSRPPSSASPRDQRIQDHGLQPVSEVDSPAPLAGEPLIEKSPTTPRSENLESVIQKIAQTGTRVPDVDDVEDQNQHREFSASPYKVKRKGANRPQPINISDVDDFEDQNQPREFSVSPLKKVKRKGADRPQSIDLSDAVVKPHQTEPNKCTSEDGDEVQIMASKHHHSGATVDDAMDVDASPSEQLMQENCHQTQPSIEQDGQEEEGTESAHGKPDSLVSSKWLLDKLGGLNVDNFDAGRAALVQELRDMEESVARLPRADMHPPSAASAGGSPGRRLRFIENLIAPDLARIPPRTWRDYKSKLLRMCADSNIHNMDYRQRLARIQQIVYLPEELELANRGDEERMACAIRVCAAVTEITGREDEIVPEEMAAWVDVQLKDMAWKAKVTSVWRKYWPEEKNGVAVK